MIPTTSSLVTPEVAVFITYGVTSDDSMMTSSNGNIFRVTGPLCGDFTGPGEFPAQRPATQSFDVFFDLCLNKRLSKQPWGWWFETPSWSLWRQCNESWHHDNYQFSVMSFCRKETCRNIALLLDILNSLWLMAYAAIWRHRHWSTLAQLMACCRLEAPSHHLN